MTAVETINSVNMTNVVASPIVITNGVNCPLRSFTDTIVVPTTSEDDIGDLWLFGPIQTNAKLDSVTIFNDQLDSNGTPTLAVKIGLYYSGIGETQLETVGETLGTAIVDDLFAASGNTQFQAAHTSGTEFRFGNTNTGKTPLSTAQKELWDLGGLASDPMGYFCIGVKVTATAATAVQGNVTLRVTWHK